MVDLSILLQEQSLGLFLSGWLNLGTVGHFRLTKADGKGPTALSTAEHHLNKSRSTARRRIDIVGGLAVVAADLHASTSVSGVGGGFHEERWTSTDSIRQLLDDLLDGSLVSGTRPQVGLIMRHSTGVIS